MNPNPPTSYAYIGDPFNRLPILESVADFGDDMTAEQIASPEQLAALIDAGHLEYVDGRSPAGVQFTPEGRRVLARSLNLAAQFLPADEDTAIPALQPGTGTVPMVKLGGADVCVFIDQHGQLRVSIDTDCVGAWLNDDQERPLLTITVNGDRVWRNPNRVTRFYITPEGEPERQVTRAQYVRTERANGFHNTTGQPTQPATQSFSGPAASGRTTTKPTGSAGDIRTGDHITILRERNFALVVDHVSSAGMPDRVFRVRGRLIGDDGMPLASQHTGRISGLAGEGWDFYDILKPAGVPRTQTVWTTEYDATVTVYTSEEEAVADVRDQVRRANLGRPFDGDDGELCEYAADVIGMYLAEHEIPANATSIWTTFSDDGVDVHGTRDEVVQALRRHAARYSDSEIEDMSDDALLAFVHESSPHEFDSGDQPISVEEHAVSAG